MADPLRRPPERMGPRRMGAERGRSEPTARPRRASPAGPAEAVPPGLPVRIGLIRGVVAPDPSRRGTLGIVLLPLARVRLWWENAFWPVPLLGMVVACGLQQLTVTFDEALADIEGSVVSPAAALTLLAAIGGGMVTFTGFVFSVILLMLQYGSSTYSPRSAAYFLRMRRTQVVLGVFLGTITFSFLALVEVGSGGRAAFTPLASIATCVGLLLLSLVGFLTLVQGIGTTLKVDGLLSAWGRMARRRLTGRASAARRRDAQRLPVGSLPSAPHGENQPGTVVVRRRGRSGQVVGLDIDRAVDLARRAGADIELLVRLGDGVGRGAAVAHVRGGRAIPELRIERCVVVAAERSLKYDPLYAIRLLTDVSLRALSPAVNDPTTAVRSLDEIETVLRTAAMLPLGPVRVPAGAGSLTVPGVTWDDVVDLCLLEVVEASFDQPQVTRRLSALISDLLEDLPEDRRAAIYRYLDVLAQGVRSAGHDPLTWLRGDRQGLGGGGPSGVV